MRPLNLLLLWFAEKRTRAHFLLTATENYTHFVIRDTLLNGIADSEIRREILRTADILATAVNVIALVEYKEMAWNAIPSTYVSAMSEFKRVKNSAPGKDHQTSVRKQFTSAASDQSTRLPCPGCKKLFSLYREGARGWNTGPYTLCLDCFRKRRGNQREATSPFPSPAAIHATSEPNASTAHLGTVAQVAPPNKKATHQAPASIDPGAIVMLIMSSRMVVG